MSPPYDTGDVVQELGVISDKLSQLTEAVNRIADVMEREQFVAKIKKP